ncbi:CPBP family intramembrane glutamic endopeptidase [Yoonia sp.]|uniref:CPBP family intramembrane glutamic endopeptidase n=1 Tax=Yoonia sp. TaxID=2212373 RepID=UPI001A020A3F|nr:CPBP family intramembrane glutamic endopeptidase [Yoonia sp.]MBE0412006.1 CPBP family intramembrane metalloprotease [Yoonia sp.]
MSRDPYTAHADFIRPATACTDMRRVLVMVAGFELAFWFAPVIVGLLLPEPLRNGYVEGTSAFATLLQFGTFGITALIFVRMLQRVHGRGFWSLIGPPEPAMTSVWRVTLAVGAVLLALEILPPWIAFAELAEVRSLLRWVAFLPLALVVLVIQVTTEEIYFRGYLQQQLAVRSSSRILWMGLPSLIFGLSHYYNGIGPADSTLYVIWATALGLACADLTARSGNLGAAIGLHLANNAFALLLVGIAGWPASGLALFLYPAFDPADYDYSLRALATLGGVLEILSSVAMVFVLWLAARIAIRR